MAYLDDNPQRYPQQRSRVAWGWNGPTGLVTVHTAEGALDRIAPDRGAENVANYITTRSDAGGYHVLVDQDSTIVMARDDMMTWHTAAYNLNGPGWGVSAACRSVEWDPDAEWTQNVIGRMGAAVREFWQRQGHNVAASARWLTHDQVRNAGGRIVGLIHHGVIQPSDRSDAWALHPRRGDLDAMLVAAILDTPTTPTPPPITKDWFTMATQDDLRRIIREEFSTHQEGDPAVQLNGALFRLIPQPDGGLKRRWIAGTSELAGLQQTGQVRRGPAVDITPETEQWFRFLPAIDVPGTPF